MAGTDWGRTLRGLAGNAVVWGLGWGAAALAVLTGRLLLGLAPEGIGFLDGVGMAIRIGVMGGIASVVFAGVMRLFYRGRRLRDLSVARFTLVGGVVTGLFVPLFMETMSVLSGGGLVPWSLVRGDILFSTLFGAAAAGGSLWLAQRAEGLGAGEEEPDLLDSGNPLERMGVTPRPAATERRGE